MGARLDEGEDHRPARAQVLGLDRWLHPMGALHLPADVDLQAGVRRVGPVHRAPQVLLSAEPAEEWTCVGHGRRRVARAIRSLVYHSPRGGLTYSRRPVCGVSLLSIIVCNLFKLRTFHI